MTKTQSFKWEGYSWWMILVAVMGLIGLLTACGDGNVPKATERTTLSGALLSMSKDSMHLNASALDSLRKAFNENFSLTRGGTIMATELELPWQDLATWIGIGANDHAIRFEYGLRDSSFALGLVRLKLDTTDTPGLYQYTLPDSLFELHKGGLDGYIGEKWRAERQYSADDTTTYFAGVQRKGVSGEAEPITHGIDAQAEVLPWELELLPLYDANKNGHGDSTFHAVFTCIARADSANVLQQRIAVHLRLRPARGTGYRDLLDDSHVPGNPFFMHAADYGMICPSICDQYQLLPQ